MAASATDLPLTDACGALVGDHPQCTILLPECNIYLAAAFSSHFRRENVVHSIVALHYSLFSATIMVDRSVQVFKEYEERLRSSDNVPRFSYGRRMMRDDGDPNRYFLVVNIDWSQCSLPSINRAT